MVNNEKTGNRPSEDFSGGTIAWRSPSNIALIKYWGKKGFQISSNPSISMTLSDSYTETLVKYRPSQNPGKISFDFFFEGEKKPQFGQKISTFLEAISDIFPFLKNFHLEIHSSNTFPHSAGIASSASAMSALALCLCSMEQQIAGDINENDDFFQKASNIARIGSGSASRSIYGGFVTWGKIDSLPETSDFYASPLKTSINPIFQNLRDTILIINKKEKAVSSRAGHGLMENHPFAEARITQAYQNLDELSVFLTNGDFDGFVKIVENEALTLHALMMASNPGYLLLQSGTLNVIRKISNFRKQTRTNIVFTLDAGPNVHLLYPERETKTVKDFIKNELLTDCDENKIIDDKLGEGPKKLK
jgi:diphosphomevalonate decarboxylase